MVLSVATSHARQSVSAAKESPEGGVEMTIEEIEVRNKRGQGSFQQREDIAFLLSKLRRAEEERDKVMESFATLGANMAHKLSKLEAESDRAKAVIEAAKKLKLEDGKLHADSCCEYTTDPERGTCDLCEAEGQLLTALASYEGKEGRA